MLARITRMAPVADEWQDKGLGSEMMRFAQDAARGLGRRSMILAGGVHARNERGILRIPGQGTAHLVGGGGERVASGPAEGQYAGTIASVIANTLYSLCGLAGYILQLSR
jgi:hypothetical protein